MGWTISSILASTALLMGGEPEKNAGYLWMMIPDGKGGLLKHVVPYHPREGDLVFFDDHSEWWTKLYKIAGTAPPFHVGINIRKPDGSLACLESGPDDTLHVYILDLWPRLTSFKGTIQIRQALKTLSPEESTRLTQFAQDNEGKRYAMWRLLLQGTSVKCRGPWREDLLAKTHDNRHRWLCAEIVVAAGTQVGLFDPKVVRANVTYPLDILDDHIYNLTPTFAPAAYWSPHP